MTDVISCTLVISAWVGHNINKLIKDKNYAPKYRYNSPLVLNLIGLRLLSDVYTKTLGK